MLEHGAYASGNSPDAFAAPIQPDEQSQQLSHGRPDATNQFDPPPSLLLSLCNTYTAKIDNQPISVFNPSRLSSQVKHLSPMLRYSFLALTTRHSDDDFFADDRKGAIDFYKSNAVRLLSSQVMVPVVNRDVLASLCLLILGEIEGTLIRCKGMLRR